MRRRAAIAVAALTVGLGLPACSDSGNDWRDADRTFVAEMIPHHHLGMTLVDEATRRSYDVRLRRLVFEMSGYHASELETLDTWSDAQSIAPAQGFPGDVPPSEVAHLAELDRIDHDIWWLAVMIRHHRGAVAIADAELGDGDVMAVRKMATTVRSVQSTEIEQMEALRAELCSQTSPPNGPEGCH